MHQIDLILGVFVESPLLGEVREFLDQRAVVE